ncbi:MAG: helix-turn-helix domain-containing protein [Prevotellaceae bacterium]|nr:helix-turn-helix domain-containing protein [Prevotellaceae bacterium]
MRRYLLLLLIALFFSRAECEPDFRVKSIDDITMNSLAIDKILQTDDGFVWFSSKNGLFRYDSYSTINFKLYSAERTYNDTEGNLWCIEDGNAYLFNTKDCRYINVLEKFSKDTGKRYNISKIRTMSDGFTWLLCDDNSCLRIDNKHPQDDIKVVYKNHDPITTIYVDAQQNTWLLADNASYTYKNGKLHREAIVVRHYGVTDGCVWLLDKYGHLCYFNYSTQKITAYKPLADKRFEKISSTSSNTLFATLGSESYQLGKNGKVLGTYPTTDTDAFYEEKGGRMWHFPNVRFYCEDKYGTIWAATNDGRLLYIDKKSGELKQSVNMQKFSTDLDFALKNYKQYFIDYQKNLWLLTDTKVYHVTFFRRPHERIIENLAVRTLFKDSKQRIWVAGRNEPVVRIYDKNLTDYKCLSSSGQLTAGTSRFSDLVCAVHEDKEGNIWLGTSNSGLIQLKETANGFTTTTFSTATTHGALKTNSISDITEDRLGRLWIATENGLHCANSINSALPKFIRLNEGGKADGKSSMFSGLTMTSKGILFASTPDGLVIADARQKDLRQIKLHRHKRDNTRKESLSSNTIMGISEMKNGLMLICTETGGLNLLVSKNWLDEKLDFTTFESRTREPLNACRWAFEHNNALYVFSSSLLTILTRDKYSEVIAQSHMKYAQLMFSEAKPLQIDKNKWLCGLYDGCISIDVDELSTENIKPKFHLIMVQKGNNEPDYSYMNKDSIVLNSNERDLVVDFAALDYSGHYDAKYAINKSKDADTWQFLGKNNRISFVGMSPGEYHYFIRYTSSNGIWIDDEFELTIIVKPKFWETAWAQILFVLLLALIIFLSIRHYNYVKNIKQQQKDTLNAYMELLNHRAKEEQDTAEKSVAAAPKVQIESQSDEMIKRVMAFIEQHLSDSDVNIDDMASAAAVSKSMLHVKIKEILGVTPGKLITEARIKKACDMLADESLSITEIAFSCGFSDPKYFSRSFKKATGETPSDYRTKVTS